MIESRTGNRTLYATAFPTLRQLLIDSAKLIPNPNVAEIEAGRKTVYDTWMAQSANHAGNKKQPL